MSLSLRSVSTRDPTHTACGTLLSKSAATGQNAQYQASLNQWAGLAWQGDAFSLMIYHFDGGPSLKVNCLRDAPDNDDQTKV